MISRRGVLIGSATFVAMPVAASCAATPTQASLADRSVKCRGSREQGSLVVCTTQPGSSVSVDDRTVVVSPEGFFAFGFAFDQTKSALISVLSRDGIKSASTVEPVARHYEIQRVNGLPEKYVTPPPEVLERIKRENQLVFEARKADTPGIAFAGPFDWPTEGIISGTFGSQRIDNGTPMAPHFGVDIAAPEGRPIRAPADGIVSLAAPDFYLTGGTTVLDHGHGVSTVYIHQSALKVKSGDVVKRGDVIGLVGMKGRATGPHLHWGMNWFQVRLDPSRSTATPAPPKG